MNDSTSPAIQNGLTGYDSQGFVSYSLYFEDANFINEPGREDMMVRFAPGQYSLFGQLKIVTMDANGKILKTSGAFLAKGNFLNDGVPSIKYNYLDNTATVCFEPYFFYSSLFTIGSLVLFGIPSAVASMVVKMLTALLFKAKPFRLIIVLSLATQSLIALATPFLWGAFAATELLAVSTEFIVLTKKALQPARPKLIPYLIIANLITAVLNVLVFGDLYQFYRL